MRCPNAKHVCTEKTAVKFLTLHSIFATIYSTLVLERLWCLLSSEPQRWFSVFLSLFFPRVCVLAGHKAASWPCRMSCMLSLQPVVFKWVPSHLRNRWAGGRPVQSVGGGACRRLCVGPCLILWSLLSISWYNPSVGHRGSE